jgi:hypothetical protein
MAPLRIVSLKCVAALAVASAGLTGCENHPLDLPVNDSDNYEKAAELAGSMAKSNNDRQLLVGMLRASASTWSRTSSAYGTVRQRAGEFGAVSDQVVLELGTPAYGDYTVYWFNELPRGGALVLSNARDREVVDAQALPRSSWIRIKDLVSASSGLSECASDLNVLDGVSYYLTLRSNGDHHVSAVYGLVLGGPASDEQDAQLPQLVRCKRLVQTLADAPSLTTPAG